MENGKHLGLQTTQKNVMDSSNGCISTNMYERKIREALEINKLRTINEKDKTFTVSNRDNGNYAGAQLGREGEDLPALFWKAKKMP